MNLTELVQIKANEKKGNYTHIASDATAINQFIGQVIGTGPLRVLAAGKVDPDAQRGMQQHSEQHNVPGGHHKHMFSLTITDLHKKARAAKIHVRE